ncbi:hypothetical protein KCU95_g9478, partial [Aureobasidium melanogenum]
MTFLTYQGKVIIVTGGSSGLGKERVHQLAKHNPAKVYLTARTNPLSRDRYGFFRIYKTSFQSLDILMNNAGLAGIPPGMTADALEIQFGTNYMGPALLTKLLLPLLLETAKQPNSDVRIINLSSGIFKQAPKQGIIFADLETPMQKTGSVAKYGQYKLGNYFFTKVCAQKYPTIKSVALHPGIVNTEIKSGAFYTANGNEYTDSILKNDKLADEPWVWTKKEFTKHGF